MPFRPILGAAGHPDGTSAGSAPAPNKVVVTKAESAAAFDTIHTLGGIDGDGKGHELAGDVAGYMTVKLKNALVSSATCETAGHGDVVEGPKDRFVSLNDALRTAESA